MTRILGLALLAVGLFGLVACDSPPPLVFSQIGELPLRTMQSRVYPTGDHNAALRAVIFTLQDQGYSIDSVEGSAGTVTATKLAELRLSAAAYPRGKAQTVIRANAIVMVGGQGHQVDDPTFYQKDFFDPLSHAIGLGNTSITADDVSAAPAILAITPDSIRPGAGKDAK